MNCPPHVTGVESYRHLLDRFGPWKVTPKGRAAFRCPLADRHRHEDRSPSAWAMVGCRGELVLRCSTCRATWRDFAAFLGLPVTAFFAESLIDPRGSASRANRRCRVQQAEVARYSYEDASGFVVAEKVRYEPGQAGRKKEFQWHRRVPADLIQAAGIAPAADGVSVLTDGVVVWHALAGGWLAPTGRYVGHRQLFEHVQEAEAKAGKRPTVRVETVDPPLFRLPKLLAAAFEVPVFLVEGEKDVLLLESLGLLAACGPHGASKWIGDWADAFLDRRVVVVMDNNLAGIGHAEHVVGSLMCRGVREIRCLHNGVGGYAPPSGGGIGNWIEATYPHGEPARDIKAGVVAVTKAARVYKSDEPTPAATGRGAA